MNRRVEAALFLMVLAMAGAIGAAAAPKEVIVFEVQDQTASGKVTAWWGTDYILLGKYDGKWMIRQVMWQTLPPR